MAFLFPLAVEVNWPTINVAGLIGMIVLAVRYGYVIRSAFKEAREARDEASSRSSAFSEKAHSELEDARCKLNETLQNLLLVRDEERTILRERIAVLEESSSTFRKQYDASVVQFNELRMKYEISLNSLTEIKMKYEVAIQQISALTTANQQMQIRLDGFEKITAESHTGK